MPKRTDIRKIMIIGSGPICGETARWSGSERAASMMSSTSVRRRRRTPRSSTGWWKS